MAYFSDKLGQFVIKSFLSDLRKELTRRSLDLRRLPGWLTAADVRLGWVNDSLIAVLEDSQREDTWRSKGAVGADTIVLLDTEDFTPTGASLRARDVGGLIFIAGAYGEEGRSTINLVSQRPALFDCGYAGYHGPRALCNLFFQLSPPDLTIPGPVAIRFVPFALYVHARDAEIPKRPWQLSEEHLGRFFEEIHNSASGDFYEKLQTRASTFESTKKSSVIVLGKDTGDERRELAEVRDFLKNRAYEAQLISDLPEIPMMSIEEKVRLWTGASRFTVMVDRVPAGHVAEYMILRGQRSILALIRPKGDGSTYMIGDDNLVDINFIKHFEFEETPLEVLDDAIHWAETIAAERAAAYDKVYPWRQ